MDPSTMMMLATLIPAILNIGGKDEQRGSTYTPGQQSLIDEATGSLRGGPPNINENPQFQQGQEWLSSLFNDPQFFQKFEAPLMRQFNEEIVPGLANRFASQGSGGSLGSTGFRNQLAREGSNLSTNIAALRGGMQQQGVNQGLQYAQQPIANYMDYLKTILSPQPNNTYQGASNPWANILGPLAQGWMQNPNNMAGGGSQVNSGSMPFAGQNQLTY